MSGFVAIPPIAWAIASEYIPKPWDRECAIADLRYWADQYRMGMATFPTQKAFEVRWGWKSWRQVSKLVNDVPGWADPLHLSESEAVVMEARSRLPRSLAGQERGRSGAGAGQERGSDEPENADNANQTGQERGRSGAGAGQERGIRARAYYTDPPITDPPNNKIPPSAPSADADDAPLDPPAVEEVPPQNPPPDIEGCWEDLTAFTSKPSAWKLTSQRRKHLGARIREHGEAAVRQVAVWVRTSDHERAVFLRERIDVDTLLRPEKFAVYLAFSNEGARARAAPPGLRLVQPQQSLSSRLDSLMASGEI